MYQLWNKPSRFFVFLALMSVFVFFVGVLPVSAGLTFVKNRIEVSAKVDATMISIPFEFENKTDKVIKISRYDSSCSCVSARVVEPMGKMTYKPGEKGKIVIDFELDSFSGTVEKTLMLWTTDDPDDNPSTVLTSVITIPVLFEITPEVLFWDQNGDVSPKTIKIKVHNDKPIHILKHKGTNSNFPYKIKTIKEGWEYEITVTPQSVKSMCMGLISLTTDAEIFRYKHQRVYVSVRPSSVKSKKK